MHVLAQDSSQEALLGRLHAAALQLDQGKHSQATVDAAIDVAVQALQTNCDNTEIAVHQSALHVLTLAARDPTNAHELSSLQVLCGAIISACLATHHHRS